MLFVRALGAAVSLAASSAAYCYSGATSFETGAFKPDYTTTSGGVISHNMHFGGFAIVNDGTPQSPNTGVSDEDYPYFIAFNLANQGSSASLSPSLQPGSGYTSFNLRTVNFACFEDKAGRSSSLPAVDCDVTLACYKGGVKKGAQTFPYTCGSNEGDCGTGLKNAPMQAAPLNIANFACCDKITFGATPKTDNGYPVAVGFDTFSYLFTSTSAISGGALLPDSDCGCS